jgi:hypothetical protein
MVAHAEGLALGDVEFLGIGHESGAYRVNSPAADERTVSVEICELDRRGRRHSKLAESIAFDGALIRLYQQVDGHPYLIVFRIVRAYGPFCSQPDGGLEIQRLATRATQKQRIPHPLARRFSPCSDARHVIER